MIIPGQSATCLVTYLLGGVQFHDKAVSIVRSPGSCGFRQIFPAEPRAMPRRSSLLSGKWVPSFNLDIAKVPWNVVAYTLLLSWLTP